MRPLVFAASVAVGSAAWLAASGARAQTPFIYNQQTLPPAAAPPSAEPAETDWDTKGQSGLELQAGGGLMSAGGDSPVQAPSLYPANISGNPTGAILNPASCPSGQTCTPYGVDPFGLVFSAGWRFLPQLSVGAFFSYASYNVQNGADAGDAPDFTSQLTRSHYIGGIYGRYYLTTLSARLQPWAELGIGYSYDGASYQRPLGQAINAQPETGFYNISATGLAVPITLGLDWRLAPYFAVGPTVGYEPIIPLGGCVEVDVDQQSNVPGQNTCSSPVSAHYYGVFFGGIFAKVTFGHAAR